MVTKQQKLANTKFFEQILRMLPENGMWIWPDTKQTYSKINGKLLGTGYGIELIKDITISTFHSNLQKL